jgi:molybdate transport system permease protein
VSVPPVAPDAVPDASSTHRGRGASLGDRLGEAGVVAATLVAAIFLLLPVLALLARALLGGALGSILSPRIVDALVLSLATSSATVVLALVFGMPLALALARRAFRGRSLLEVIVDLPIVLPPAVAGLALLLVFGRRGLLGGALESVGIVIPFTIVAVVLAQTFVAAPLFVRSARAGFADVDREVEDAARADGAGEVGVFRHVTAPLASGALAAGLVMTWSRALGEFGATIMFAGAIQGRTETLPVAVYAEFQVSLDDSIAAGAILVVVAFAVLAIVRLGRWRSAFDLGRLR